MSTSGDTVYYRPAAGGGFTVTAGSTDAQSGVSYGFPTLPTGWSASGTGASRTYTYTANPTAPTGNQNVTATNGAGLTATTPMTFTADSTAPAGQSVALSGGPGFGTAAVPLTIDWGSDAGSGLDTATKVVERDSAALSNGSCGTFSGTWTPVTLAGGADTTVQTGTCYRYRVHVSDNVGNTSDDSPASADALVDTTAPTAPGLSYSATSNVYASGDTLYYRAGTAGGFTVTADSSDAESGVSYGFPTLPTGWSVSGTGASRTYTYTANPTAPTGNQDVTATNGAGLTASTAMTFTADTTAPTGQTVTRSGGPWYTTLSIPLTIDWGSDAGAGLATATGTVERRLATLANGACGSFGSWAAVTLNGGADTTVANAKCYEYRVKISDNVGNVSAYSATTADAYVDTSAPTATVLLSTSSPNTYVNAAGTTVYYNGQGSYSGAFTATVTPTDGQSGIQKVTFPAVTGMTGGGDAASPGPYAMTYNWTASTTASGAQTTTTYNNAGLAATKTFTTTKDVTNPTGQTVALSGGPYFSSLSVPLTIGNGSDSGSGVNASSLVVERDGVAMSNGTCTGYPGTWSAVSLVGGADTTVQSGTCYRYRIRISDNVGNTSANSTATADAKVDTTAPAAPAITAPTAVTGAANQHYDAPTSTLWFQPSASGSFQLNATAADADRGSPRCPSRPVRRVRLHRRRQHRHDQPVLVDDVRLVVGGRNARHTNADGDQQLRPHLAGGDDHDLPRLDRTVRPDSRALRRALVHDRFGAADARLGHGRRRRPRRHERRSSSATPPRSPTARAARSRHLDARSPLSAAPTRPSPSGTCYRYRTGVSDNVGNQSANSTASADAKIDTTPPSAPSLDYTASRTCPPAATRCTTGPQPAAASPPPPPPPTPSPASATASPPCPPAGQPPAPAPPAATPTPPTRPHPPATRTSPPPTPPA